MKKYVVGFLISGSLVSLIKKNRPEWQKGKINGIGGKIEKGETPEQAMKREFYEEAGIRINKWKRFAVLNHKKHGYIRYIL
jgi:8-oxo-dGTP diphosphatase